MNPMNGPKPFEFESKFLSKNLVRKKVWSLALLEDVLGSESTVLLIVIRKCPTMKSRFHCSQCNSVFEIK